MTTACPDDETIAAFAAATLPRPRRAQVQEHLDSCPSCHDVLRELAELDAVAVGSSTSSSSGGSGGTVTAGGAPSGPALADTVADVNLRGAPIELSVGMRFDGYLLRRRLDAGAMGEVWIGEDLELARQVAVKVLRGAGAGAPGVLRNEARALAQLAHPNVVTVHRVAEWQGREYIAMEYVAGVNLREWLAGKPSLAERLDAMIQAGRGLAAAHAAGIVHRDFKPSNVLMGHDGRVRVGDFGLARAGLPTGSVTSARASVSTAAAGTPVYMAPEQLRGGPATFAGDQYSFAVSLFEAIHGLRPFGGDTTGELAAAIERGEPRPGGARVPGWLRAVVARGLSADPEKRFPSVAAMVDALDAGRKRRRRALVAASMVGVAVATAAIAIPLGQHAAAAPGCGGEDVALAAVWSPERAADIRLAFEKVAGKFGIEQWQSARPLFDAYGKRWTTMRHETCEATRVRHQQSDSLFDKRMQCLDRRLAQLGAVAGALAQVDANAQVMGVMEVAGRLPSLDPCADTRWLSDEPTPPPAQRAAIDAAFKELDAARGLDVLGKYKDALTAAKALAPRVQALAFTPLVADVAMLTATSADHVGEFALAESEYEHASNVAAELHRTDMVFEAQAHVMKMEAHQQHFDRALGRAATLESLARLSSDPLHRAMQHESVANLYDQQGKYKEAAEEYRQSLALLPEGAPGERQGTSRQGLGLMLLDMGDFDGAERELNQALELRRARYGANHPYVAQTLGNLGVLEYMRGHYAKALEYWQKNYAILQEATQGTDPDIALCVGNIALAQQALDDLDGALVSLKLAIELRIKAFGLEHPEVALAKANMGLMLAKAGRYAEAEREVHEAIAMRIKVQGADHPDLVRTYDNLAEVLLWKGQYAADDAAVATPAFTAAIEACDQALDLATKKLEPSSPQIWFALFDRSRAEVGLGATHAEAARADATRALELGKSLFPDDADETIAVKAMLGAALLMQGHAAEAATLLAPVAKLKTFESSDQGTAAFYLAQAWWAVGRRDDALSLMQRAIAFFDESKENEMKGFAKRGRAWMAERRH